MVAAMHAELSQSLIETVTQRRGRRFLFPKPDTKRTALVVVDMQNAFVAEGAPGEVPLSRAIVPNINRLAAALREAGGTVVWILSALEEGEGKRGWGFLFNRVMAANRRSRMLEWLSTGNPGYELWPALTPAKSDLYIDKDRYSAFIQGSSKLDETLRARGIERLLITGTLTNVCCESTARDGMMLDYEVEMISDGNAALHEHLHQGALTSFMLSFGDVLTTDEAITRLQP